MCLRDKFDWPRCLFWSGSDSRRFCRITSSGFIQTPRFLIHVCWFMFFFSFPVTTYPVSPPRGEVNCFIQRLLWTKMILIWHGIMMRHERGTPYQMLVGPRSSLIIISPVSAETPRFVSLTAAHICQYFFLFFISVGKEAWEISLQVKKMQWNPPHRAFVSRLRGGASLQSDLPSR